jgi:hypothetical protein
MSQTRAAIDQKISRLEACVHELSPRAYVRRHTPDYFAERVIGTTLMLIGTVMAWRLYRGRARRRVQRRNELRAALAAPVCA